MASNATRCEYDASIRTRKHEIQLPCVAFKARLLDQSSYFHSQYLWLRENAIWNQVCISREHRNGEEKFRHKAFDSILSWKCQETRSG